MLDFHALRSLEELTGKAFAISLKFWSFWYITQFDWIDPIYYGIRIITIFPYFFLKNWLMYQLAKKGFYNWLPLYIQPAVCIDYLFFMYSIIPYYFKFIY